MSKYVEAAVDEFLKAIETFGDEVPLAIRQAAKALRPKPEMEYVLCEFKPDWRDLDGEPMMYAVANGETRSYSQSEWSFLREATRIPARPKVTALTAEDLEKIWYSTHSGQGFFAKVAKAINAKQGVGE